MPNQDAMNSANQILTQMGSTGLIALAVVALIFLIAWWCIFAKAGFPGALAFLMFIPLVNLIMLLILAFSPWPIRRQLNALRAGAPVI